MNYMKWNAQTSPKGPLKQWFLIFESLIAKTDFPRRLRFRKICVWSFENKYECLKVEIMNKQLNLTIYFSFSCSFSKLPQNSLRPFAKINLPDLGW